MEPATRLKTIAAIGMAVAMVAAMARAGVVPALHQPAPTAPVKSISFANSKAADRKIDKVVWQVTEMNGAPLPEDAVITLELRDGQVSGRSGCNRYSGAYKVDQASHSLRVKEGLVSTRMACLQPIMALEERFQSLLSSVTGYRVNDGPVLVLLDGHDDVLHLMHMTQE